MRGFNDADVAMVWQMPEDMNAETCASYVDVLRAGASDFPYVVMKDFPNAERDLTHPVRAVAGLDR